MATPYTVRLDPADTGLLGVAQTAAAAAKASELLQQDLKAHHTFFNADGFHNHIPHHVLALFGTGAPPGALQAAFDGNTSYQRPALPAHDGISTWSWESARAHLGKEEHYPDFLGFFQEEMARRGGDEKAAGEVVGQFVLAGGEQADDMLARLFAGFLHPLIQLMCGMEWAQPAVVAEALAQAAVHGADIGGYLLEAEEAAAGANEEEKEASIVELLEAIRADEKLRRAAVMGDANKIRDGVLGRARDEMVRIAQRVRVRPDELDEKTAEMFDACVYMASAAAFHKGKVPKFDFFLMHHVNASPIFLTINAQDWITPETKARLLEWKIRMDLIEYAARGSPPLSVDSIAQYQQRKSKAGETPLDIVSRLHFYPDDGHAIKLGRAALVCRGKSAEYVGTSWMKIKGDELWHKVCHLIVDSVETPGPRWVRTCGLDEAWENVPDAEQEAKL